MSVIGRLIDEQIASTVESMRADMRATIATARYIEGNAPRFARVGVGDIRVALLGDVGRGGAVIFTYGTPDQRDVFVAEFVSEFSDGKWAMDNNAVHGYAKHVFEPAVEGDVKIVLQVKIGDE